MLVLPGIERNYAPRSTKIGWPESLVVQRQFGKPVWGCAGDAIRVEYSGEIIREGRLAATPRCIDVNDKTLLESALLDPSGRTGPQQPSKDASDPVREIVPPVRILAGLGLRVDLVLRAIESSRQHERKIAPVQEIFVRFRGIADEQDFGCNIRGERRARLPFF